MKFVNVIAACILSVVVKVKAAEDGLARTPPMGWRTWNSFQLKISDDLMRRVADAFTDKSRLVDGKPTSLADLGYVDIGIDDNWQECFKGPGKSYHAADGTPLINKVTFPDMKSMTDYAHQKGLKMGWYGNNCICQENKNNENPKAMKKDAEALQKFGFDSIKLDNCGPYLDLDQWYDELKNAGNKTIMIENCHWGETVPNDWWCPFHMYRTSPDIWAYWGSVFNNLQSTRAYQDIEKPLSRPGCWAYPDMLETGLMPTFEQDRTHFGAWCVTSSPLILGHDPMDSAVVDRIWPIITNKVALRVNQAWNGHPGRLVVETTGKNAQCEGVSQIWNKQVSATETAVLVFHNNDESCNTDIDIWIEQLDLIFDKEFGVTVYDIWNNKYLEEQNKLITVNLKGMDSAFYLLTKKNDW